MTRSLRFIVPLIAALALASCGSEASENTASSTADANALLRTTFSNFSKMKSATLDAKLKVDAGAGSSEGPVSASLSGPFESQGPNRLPKLGFTAQMKAGGQSFDAGVTYDGSKAYLTLMGTSYEVSDLVVKQFVAGYEQALKSQQSQQQQKNPLGSLGIDFTKWLPNAKNEGEAQVGDAKTIKISGDADVKRIVDDLDTLTQKAASLNLPGTGSQLPQKLTPQQKQEAIDAIKRVTVTVYTGVDDEILRRLTVDAELNGAKTNGAAALNLDITFTNVNQKQTITTPQNPKPFSELLKMLNTAGLGDLGSLGGLGGGSSSGSGGGSGSSATPNNVDKYAKCIEQAAGDQAKARKCASLLTTG
ncbi:MAG TPA: hypothetical protein VNS09_24940 [Solirubrobacter sp.]|nr:hypothetical protein [Solirubrobacter sp.]